MVVPEIVLDFLKTISSKLLGNLFKTGQNIETQYNINVKELNVNLLSFDKEIEDNIEKIFEKFGFGRKDLIPIQSAMVTPSTLQGNVIKRMRWFLREDDTRALIISATIIKLEDDGRDDNAQELLGKLTNRHGERGRKIYNMARSGMFENFLLLVLEDLQSELKDLLKVKDEFQKFFNYILDYNPIAIWINDTTKEKEIVEGLEDRLIRLNIPGVMLYTRGKDNIGIIMNAIETFKEKYNKEVEIKKEDYKLRKRPSCTIFITLKSEVPPPS